MTIKHGDHVISFRVVTYAHAVPLKKAERNMWGEPVEPELIIIKSVSKCMEVKNSFCS